MGRKQKYDALMEFIARVQGATGLTTPHIERVINSGIDITKATPADVYKLATGMDLPGPAQAYVPKPKQNLSGAVPRLSIAERVPTDPNIQSAIKMAVPAIARTNPELAQRVAAGDTEAMLEVYRMVVKNKGEMPAPVDPFENIAASDMEGLPQEFAPMTDAQHAAFVRQLELPLDDAAPSTGMIPFGVGGPGVPAGLSGPGVSSPTHGDLILARILGLNGPQQGRLPAPSILGLPAPQQARLTGPRMLALPEGPIARRPGWHRSDAEMWQDNLDRIAERAYEFPDDAAPSVVDAIPASSYPTASPEHLVDDVYAPAGVTETGLSVPGVRGGGIPVGGPAGGPRGLSVPDRRSGINPWAATAAAGLGAAAAGVAASRLMPRSAPLTDAAGPESAPLQEPDLTLAEDTPVELNNDGLADLAAESSPPPVVSSPVPMKGLQRRPGPDTGFIETSSQYALKPAQQRTLEVMLDAGIDPDRAQAIVRGQRSLTTAEERAIISNGPARARRAEDEMMTRRNARMGAY